MSNRYSTRQDAIEQAILPALDGDDYDLDAIFDEAFEYGVDRDGEGRELLNTAGFEQIVDSDEFWVIVEKHARDRHAENLQRWNANHDGV